MTHAGELLGTGARGLVHRFRLARCSERHLWIDLRIVGHCHLHLQASRLQKRSLSLLRYGYRTQEGQVAHGFERSESVSLHGLPGQPHCQRGRRSFPEQRLARMLLTLADKIGQRHGDITEVSVTRQELADMIGATVGTTIRVTSK
ncbi:MAG: helix-turn-helix domain-containing protein [Candidatus Binatia bacterium]